MQTTHKIRDSLKADRTTLHQDYLKHGKARRLLLAHARLVDKHLIDVWQMLKMPAELSLVAVGGYGRQELYPKSDIDLLILLLHQPDEEMQQRLQNLVGVLWDIGLEVGHSVRTIDECMAESADVTVQTNLLEGRLITGNPLLFAEMHETLLQQLDKRAFFQAKQQEQKNRYTRFLDTDYNLEPNLKESPGGLRDLQTILWISRACGFGITWQELSGMGMITVPETRAIAKHESLLQTLRIRLHYLAGRREDRLLFDYQTALADEMGIKASETRRASEHLMQRYYKTKQAVIQLNKVLLQNMRAHLFPEAGIPHPINERFIARDDLLEVRDENIFEKEPTAILESFWLMQKHPGLNGFSAPTLRALWRVRSRMDASYRNDPRNRALFIPARS